MTPEIVKAIIGAIATILAAVIAAIIARGRKKDRDSEIIEQPSHKSHERKKD